MRGGRYKGNHTAKLAAASRARDRCGQPAFATACGSKVRRSPGFYVAAEAATYKARMGTRQKAAFSGVVGYNGEAVVSSQTRIHLEACP